MRLSHDAAMTRRYRADPMAVLRRLGQAQIGSATTTEGQASVRLAFSFLHNGSGAPSDFDRLVKALNTAKIRALEIGAPELIDAITAGQLTLSECRRRYTEHGRFGFAGPELKSMADALDAYEAIENASSALQMEEAWRTSLRSLELNKKLTKVKSCPSSQTLSPQKS